MRYVNKNIHPIPFPTPGMGVSFDWPDGQVPDDAYETIPDDWTITWCTRFGVTMWRVFPPSS